MMDEGAANNTAGAAALQDLDLEAEEMEMEALLQSPFNKPHQLLRRGDDLLVAIASVEELDTALAAAPPSSFNGVRVLRGYVLPTASYKDCLLLKAAAEAVLYPYGGGGATRFSLADHAVIDAKMSARASVDQARAILGDIVSELSASPAAAGVETTTAAPPSPWGVDTVESTRREVQQHIETTIAHIKALSERLDSL